MGPAQSSSSRPWPPRRGTAAPPLGADPRGTRHPRSQGRFRAGAGTGGWETSFSENLSVSGRTDSLARLGAGGEERALARLGGLISTARLLSAFEPGDAGDWPIPPAPRRR